MTYGNLVDSQFWTRGSIHGPPCGERHEGRRARDGYDPSTTIMGDVPGRQGLKEHGQVARRKGIYLANQGAMARIDQKPGPEEALSRTRERITPGGGACRDG